MIYEASLDNLRQLRYQVFFFEEQVVLAILGIDEETLHCLKEKVEYLFEIGHLVQVVSACKDVAIKDL